MSHVDLRCPASALEKETADRVFYLATDLYAVDNPHYHDAELYPFEDVLGHNKLRTPLFNNLSLKASLEASIIKSAKFSGFLTPSPIVRIWN